MYNVLVNLMLLIVVYQNQFIFIIPIKFYQKLIFLVNYKLKHVTFMLIIDTNN